MATDGAVPRAWRCCTTPSFNWCSTTLSNMSTARPTHPMLSAWQSLPREVLAAACSHPLPTSICCSCCPISRRRGESVVEYLLYLLWDLGLKVGHATRSVEQSLKLSRSDITIRTALIDARYI